MLWVLLVLYVFLLQNIGARSLYYRHNLLQFLCLTSTCLGVDQIGTRYFVFPTIYGLQHTSTAT